MEPAARAARRRVEVHRRAEAGALRPADRPRRAAERDRRARQRGGADGRRSSTRSRRASARRATSPAPQPDAETIARLRSLGYVGLAAPSTGSDRGPDPKDRILQLREFRALLTRAGDDLQAGRPDAAIAGLKRALALNDRAYDAHVMLGSAWQQKGDLEKAVGEFEAAALLNPVGAAPHLLAADAFVQGGRLESAMARIDTAAGLEPESGEVAAMRGRVFERAGRGDEALAEYQRAVALNPADTAARGTPRPGRDDPAAP